MQNDAKIPITRNSLFFDDNLFKTFKDIGLDYMLTWINQKVILYQVDRIKTNSDDLYGETKPDEIKYHTPIEMPCIYEIFETKNDSYVKNNQTGRYKQSGNIDIYIFDDILKQYNCDVKYGDLIGVPIDHNTMFYYEIMDDGKRNFSNKETMFGYMRFWRTLKGVEIDENVFNG